MGQVHNHNHVYDNVVSYKVIVNGVVLNESASLVLAKNFVLTLAPDQRESAQIVPVTSDGLQILLG